MADEKEFELAEILSRRMIDIGVQQARNSLRTALLPTGACYNCQEHVGSSALFCDADCEQDYTTRRKRSVQNQ